MQIICRYLYLQKWKNLNFSFLHRMKSQDGLFLTVTFLAWKMGYVAPFYSISSCPFEYPAIFVV